MCTYIFNKVSHCSLFVFHITANIWMQHVVLPYNHTDPYCNAWKQPLPSTAALCHWSILSLPVPRIPCDYSAASTIDLFSLGEQWSAHTFTLLYWYGIFWLNHHLCSTMPFLPHCHILVFFSPTNLHQHLQLNTAADKMTIFPSAWQSVHMNDKLFYHYLLWKQASLISDFSSDISQLIISKANMNTVQLV